jgi:hypothetical protein
MISKEAGDAQDRDLPARLPGDGGALLFALVPAPAAPPRTGWSWWFALGLALAIGAHGFPEGLR